MSAPFITFYTPTYRRPKALAACLASVEAQTAVADVEQVVIPDHVGLGVGGMYRRIARYADAVHGRYVHVLADDDELCTPTVVEQVREFVEANGEPPVVIVWVNKAGMELPWGPPWPPRCGFIDLGNFIVRADVWKAHVGDYGDSYEGDYEFAEAVWQAGIEPVFCPVMFLTGAQSGGKAE